MANHPNRGAGLNPARNPTPEQIRELRAKMNLSQSQAASLVFSSTIAWQQWETPTGRREHRRMHPAAWNLFRLRTGQVTVGGLLREQNLAAADPPPPSFTPPAS